MNRPSGQAGQVIGRVLRGLAMLFLVAFAACALALGVLAWRLDQGPLNIPFVASRLATALSGAGVTVKIDRAALAWAGYKHGGGAPLYLQLAGIVARNQEGAVLASVPQARLLFPPRAIFGMAAPVDVAGEGAHLADADAAVGVAALLHFGLGFALRAAEVTVMLGPGTVGPPGEQVAILNGGFRVHLAGPDAVLTNGRLVARPHGVSAPVVTFSGTARRDTDWRANLLVTADRVQAEDLAVYWPPLVGGGARHWVTKNITAGLAKNARFTAVLTAPADLGSFRLQSIAGGFDGVALTIRWLPAATPITLLNGHLTVLDADTIDITETSARLGRLAISDGSMRINGVDQADQIADVKLVGTGRLADAIAVLDAPPLALLAQAPAGIRHATGAVRIEVAATLPLDNKLKLMDVKLAVVARLTDVAAPLPVDGLNLSGGTFELDADQRHLSAAGQGTIGGQPTTLSALTVFGQTPTLRHLQVRTVLGAAALSALGLDNGTATTDAVGGSVPLTLRLDAGADGQDVAADADLTGAKLGVPVLGWAKAAGQPGAFDATAVVAADQSLAVRSVTASGPALDVRGTLHGRDLHFSKLLIGRTSATGDVVFPARKGAAWGVNLAGSTLDLRLILNAPAKPAAAAASAAREPPPGSAADTGPPWTARLSFDTLYLARPPAPALRDFSFTGAGAGEAATAVTATAMSGAGQPVRLVIRAAARRELELTAGDGGNLLRALGAFDDLRGGALNLGATYGGGAPFAGTLTLSKFQLLKAPAAAKILQALTIYGVAEAAAGPGLVFTRLVAPFSIARGILTLRDARAYSASLGFTASGTVGLADGGCDLEATIVPAYALNALPGKIPVIGKLFTAEKGGGLLSVRVKITGPLAAPRVRLNPLSVLTPGVLRDIFGAAK